MGQFDRFPPSKPGPSGKDLMRNRREHMLNPASGVFTTIRANTIESLFYEVLRDKYPSFGLSIENFRDKKGKMVPQMLSVIATSSTHRKVVHDFWYNNPSLQILNRVRSFKGRGPDKGKALGEGLKLEREKKLDPDTTRKALAWYLNQEIKTLENEDPQKYATKIAKLRQDLKGTAVTPFTDDELREVIHKLIQEKYESMFG